MPFAILFIVFALAGERIIKSAHFIRLMWLIILLSSKVSVKTGLPVKPSSVAFPINCNAELVTTVCTSKLFCTNFEIKYALLYAAIEPEI